MIPLVMAHFGCGFWDLPRSGQGGSSVGKVGQGLGRLGEGGRALQVFVRIKMLLRCHIGDELHDDGHSAVSVIDDILILDPLVILIQGVLFEPAGFESGYLPHSTIPLDPTLQNRNSFKPYSQNLTFPLTPCPRSCNSLNF